MLYIFDNQNKVFNFFPVMYMFVYCLYTFYMKCIVAGNKREIKN